MEKGKLFVIDGTDGSGKQTQLQKLKERFDKEGIEYRTVSFPNYDSPSSSLVKMYLNGDFGTDAQSISPYIASTFYAVDRYATFKTGYQEYYDGGDFSDEAWANVGIKAVDDYTVEYTMEAPVPYFASMTTYSILYPINREFLESKGTGCALGSPDPTACEFGTTAPDSILYNGGFILDTFDLKSQTVMVKNEQYWDVENVHLDSVTYIYDDGSDPYSTIRGFEQGTYASAALNASWEDYADCFNNDWLYTGSYQWTLTPRSSSSGSVFRVGSNGGVLAYIAYTRSAVSPAIYLSSNVKISGGEGTESSPFTLSLQDT